MTKALLTGIGGSIGCHVFRHLMAKTDWHVVGIDSWRHRGYFDRVKVMLDAHPEDRERLTLITHDLTAPFSPITRDRIGDIDIVINVASLSDVHASIVNPRPFVESNVASVLTVLDFAREAKVKKFLHLSTDEVYGPTDGTGLGHTEWDPIVPSNPYSASKAAQEAIAISYWRSYNLPLMIVNLMNNFSEMQSDAKFPVIIQRKLMRGEEVTVHGTKDSVGSRVYVHSRNSADAFLHILRTVEPYIHVPGRTDKPVRFNIVGDRQVRNDELIEFIAECMGVPARYRYESAQVSRPGHDLHYGLDPRLLIIAGWKQPVSFEDSMRATVRWQMENPRWLGL